ncbi:hypothetical protein OJ997_13810 [Solirubrobacter phytolaccae]|uniref:Uncharacterized protein n=1 Tax=Solirubrobacter phytolaccae TaxID=1404360 RepID=A0A9X3NCG7_9ACTN|nr:hypothetical protein [Solirubrobacter phytolaccae]MDA0181376.1 hypothetical protein [Solirubrobacter phytolaccae]
MAVLLVVVTALLMRERIVEIDVSETAARVEKLRGLRFEDAPVAFRVSQETASSGVWSVPEAQRAMLELLDLVAPGESLEDDGGVWGAAVHGENYIVIADDGPRLGPLYESIVAHELTHTLEDQHFGAYETEEMSDDAATATAALTEGTAMLVERDYADRYLGGKRPDDGDWSDGWLGREYRFVYEEGERFVAALRDQGGWPMVDRALASRPPESSEQVLHPEKWRAGEEPLPTETPLVNLGPGWKRVDRDVWGEWRTRAIVGPRLATGWGGDQFELWRRGDEHTLVMTWEWDTESGARALADGLRARPFMRRPGAQLRHAGARVNLVLAPSDAVAARVS